MKRNLKLLLAFLLMCSTSFSQSQHTRKYRITAFKSGNPLIFSISNEAEVIPTMTIYVPNTFTPNGDGLNDTFGISGDAIKELSLVIYNRWGVKVFESENVNMHWDGTYNGAVSPQGSYAYTLSAQGITGTRQSKKGTFNLIQ